MSLRQWQGGSAGTWALAALLGLMAPGLWGWTAPAWAQWWSTDSRVLEPFAHGQVNWTEGLITGRDSATGATHPASMAATRQAAAQAARTRVRTVLEHLRLDAHQTLGAGLSQSDAAPQKLATLAAEAEVVETRYMAGGTVETTVQVAVAGALTVLAMPSEAGIRPEQAPAVEAVHTGIVIDARGLAIQPALLPRLIDEHGQTLYAPEIVEREAAVQQGYIAYARTFDQPPAQARVGERPLVLRALRVAEATRVDLVLSHADAARLRDYAATRRLLQQCRVLIMM